MLGGGFHGFLIRIALTTVTREKSNPKSQPKDKSEEDPNRKAKPNQKNINPKTSGPTSISSVKERSEFC